MERKSGAHRHKPIALQRLKENGSGHPLYTRVGYARVCISYTPAGLCCRIFNFMCARDYVYLAFRAGCGSVCRARATHSAHMSYSAHVSSKLILVHWGIRVYIYIYGIYRRGTSKERDGNWTVLFFFVVGRLGGHGTWCWGRHRFNITA